MQFFYQFPQRTERLVLISSGGLGHEVSPLLRGAALPGSAALLSLASKPRLVGALAASGARLRARGNSTGVYLQAVARALGPLQESGSRRAFLDTVKRLGLEPFKSRVYAGRIERPVREVETANV